MKKGQIITFYSYKGGVGRTMALANVAVLLARWGYKTLVVDWDLEAPGLEHFFFKKTSDVKHVQNEKGIVDLLDTINRVPENPSRLDWQDLLVHVPPSDSEMPLYLLTAGQRGDDYFTKLRSFDIDTFYSKKHGGNFIESLRNGWKENFDFILVDSRTGITDIGGICTIQLPDILVLLFTATEQGLNGVVEVAEKSLAERQKLPVDRLRLLSVPIPSKFDTDKEFQMAQEWLGKFTDALSDIYSEWLPKDAKVRTFLEITKLPYIPYFSFGEKLAVDEQGVSDPAGLGYAYETLAAIIANNLELVELIFEDREKFVNEAKLRPLDTSNDIASVLKRPDEAQIVADNLYERALDYEKEGLLEEAINSAKKAIEIWKEIVETDFATLGPKLARARRLLSDYFSHEKDMFNAIAEAGVAVTTYRKLREDKTGQFDDELASELVHLADLFIATNQFSEALEKAEESVEIYRQLANVDKDKYSADLAQGLNLVSEGLFNTGRIENSLVAGKEAIDILRVLKRANPKRFSADLASSLNILLDHISQLDEAETSNSVALARGAVQDFRELAIERPTQYLPEFGKNLNLLMELILKKDNLDTNSIKEALVLQNESINIIRDLVQSNQLLAEPELARSLVNLSKLYRKNGEFSEAQKAANEALEIFTRLSKINPKHYEEETEEVIVLLGNLKESNS
jgi:cellulose biosynthesis protein BcsQ/tetratricopeptide (TPR) repeat protein